MTTLKQTAYIIGGALALTAVAFAYFFTTNIGRANPSDFCKNQTDANGTSTLAYLSPGAATTTLTLTNCATSDGTDSAVVTFQYTASGTAPVLKARAEYSQNGIDWYPATVSTVANATTSIMTTFAEYSFNLATSTAGDFYGSGTAQRVHESFTITTPTRFTRIKFYVPASGGNGALWAEAVGKKQF